MHHTTHIQIRLLSILTDNHHQCQANMDNIHLTTPLHQMDNIRLIPNKIMVIMVSHSPDSFCCSIFQVSNFEVKIVLTMIQVVQHHRQCCIQALEYTL